jgi:hypothetical protein
MGSSSTYGIGPKNESDIFAEIKASFNAGSQDPPVRHDALQQVT